MLDFIKRLSSRKFLLTIGLLLFVTLFPDVPTEVLYLGLAYIGVEGAKDVVEAYTRSKTAPAETNASLQKFIARMQATGQDPEADPADIKNSTIVPGL